MKKFLTIATMALTFNCISANAQLTGWGSPPVDSEKFVHSVSDNSQINCANITYRSPTEAGQNGQLGVICWEQGSGTVTPGFYVFDDAGNAVTTYLPSADSKLDVIIGDGVTAASPHVGDYRVGVVYLDASSHVAVNIYDVTGVGTSSLAVTFVSTTVVASSTTYDNPRIDIIAEHNVTTVANLYSVVVFTPISLPNCSKYIVTYSDASGNINGYENDLNVPFATPPTTVFGAPLFISYGTPDVAAIQRNVSMSIHDYAIFTWVDNNGDDVYEAEWDCNSGGTVTPSQVFGTATMGTDIFCHPRIDAIDDYSINTASGQANYQIAAADAYTSGSSTYYDIAAYNGVGTSYYGSGGSGAITNILLHNNTNVAPCVAAGPGNLYSVFYGTDAQTSNSHISQPRVIQTINYSGGNLTNNKVLQVSSYNAVVSGTTCTEHQAVSTSANDHNFNLVTFPYNAAEIYYKYNHSSGTSSYKPATVANVTVGPKPELWPNPANTELNISGGSNGDAYSVSDMIGRNLIHGSFSGGNDKLNISVLQPGVYFMNIHSGETTTVLKFVKE